MTSFTTAFLLSIVSTFRRQNMIDEDVNLSTLLKDFETEKVTPPFSTNWWKVPKQKTIYYMSKLCLHRKCVKRHKSCHQYFFEVQCLFIIKNQMICILYSIYFSFETFSLNVHTKFSFTTLHKKFRSICFHDFKMVFLRNFSKTPSYCILADYKQDFKWRRLVLYVGIYLIRPKLNLDPTWLKRQSNLVASWKCS